MKKGPNLMKIKFHRQNVSEERPKYCFFLVLLNFLILSTKCEILVKKYEHFCVFFPVKNIDFKILAKIK